jgi:hypothetical protein
MRAAHVSLKEPRTMTYDEFVSCAQVFTNGFRDALRRTAHTGRPDPLLVATAAAIVVAVATRPRQRSR